MSEQIIQNKKEQKPYVVSGDIKLALKPWAAEKGFVLPNDKFFKRLRKRFSLYMTTIFPDFEFINEAVLVDGVKVITSNNTLPIISLDPLYLATENQLTMTRTVDSTGQDRGLRRRDNSPTLLRQVRSLNKLKSEEIALFDDVGFSGDMLVKLVSILSKMEISVSTVFLGIGIGEALEKLRQSKIDVQTVRSYQDVIDEICERDFYLGVPQSGRTYANDPTKGFPYILPFGNPEKWASIPTENQLEFSLFCIQQSIDLFEAIERKSGRIVRCSDIQKKIVGMPEGEQRFVDELYNVKRGLEEKIDRNVL